MYFTYAPLSIALSFRLHRVVPLTGCVFTPAAESTDDMQPAVHGSSENPLVPMARNGCVVRGACCRPRSHGREPYKFREGSERDRLIVWNDIKRAEAGRDTTMTSLGLCLPALTLSRLIPECDLVAVHTLKELYRSILK